MMMRLKGLVKLQSGHDQALTANCSKLVNQDGVCEAVRLARQAGEPAEQSR